MKIFVVRDIGDNFTTNLFSTLIDTQYLTDKVDDADIYLFCTMSLSSQQVKNISKHPLVINALHKCFLISDEDHPMPVLPGLYAALPKMSFYSSRSWLRHFRTIFYLADHNPYIKEFKGQGVPIRYLFSFVGSRTSRVRQKLFRLTFRRKDILLRATDSNHFWKDFVVVHGIRVTADNQDYLMNYTQEILQSKFVLCPRGNGNSSYRFFEVMEAGRVPVIISDSYVLPKVAYDWNDVVIRIAENDIGRIESILSENEHRFEKMAALNLKVYEEYFSNKSVYIINNLRELMEDSRLKRSAQYKMYCLKWVRPLQFYYSFKPFVGRMINKIKQKIA
jgi:hypothetical protein